MYFGGESELRLTAASNALALCCANKEANSELICFEVASLASVLVDRDDVVRNEFARKLSQAVSSGQASFARWAGALVLVALAPASGSEEKEEKRKAVAMASRALRVAVARQRRSHAQAIRRLPPGAGTNEVDRLATQYLPVRPRCPEISCGKAAQFQKSKKYEIFIELLPYAVHNIARESPPHLTRDDAKRSQHRARDGGDLLLLEPLVATAGDKGVAFLLAACADMSGHDDASGLGPCPLIIFVSLQTLSTGRRSRLRRCRVAFMSLRRLDAVDATA